MPNLRSTSPGMRSSRRSWTAETTDYEVAAFEDFAAVALPVVGDLRARYSAMNMDSAVAVDVREDDATELDRYLLQLWPAAPHADAIVKQTSEIAGYWHGVAQSLPPPLTNEDKAEADARRRAERE